MPTITCKEILDSKYCILAPSQLRILDIPNKNAILFKDLLARKLNSSDKGTEVGSINYVSQSTHYFIRTKALQEDYLLPFLSSEEAAIAIVPEVFKNLNLKEGDLIISKDGKIGEAVILDQDYPNYTISSALYKLPVSENKLYLLAFLKHHHFREQLDLLVPKGATIRHAKTLFLDCKIPFPNQKDTNKVIKYVELLIQAIINKEKEIRRKNQLIFELIEKELKQNQKEKGFEYKNPRFNELFSSLRIDAGYYCEEYKQEQFLISNYKGGAGKVVDDWKFKMKRGESLKDKYSDEPEENTYTLIIPTNISEFGTIERFKYLWNPRKLSLLEMGDILFSIDGTIGKCILFDGSKKNCITTSHSMILRKENRNLRENAFVSCFLRFLKQRGIPDYISVGGQGGALGEKYWKDVIIPYFPELKQQEISLLYYNPTENYPNDPNLENFLEKDQKWNQQAGIIELDKSAKQIKEHLNKVLDKIVNDEEVKIDFSF